MKTTWYKCAHCDAGYLNQECTCDKPVEAVIAEKIGDEKKLKDSIPNWKYNVGKSVERLAEFEKNWKNAEVLREAARILKSKEEENNGR